MNVLNNDIIFYHIPKAAGTSFYRRLGDDYSTEAVNFRSLDRAVFEKELERPDYAIWTSHPSGGFSFWEQVLARRTERQKVIFLRDPLQRLISHYYFNEEFMRAHDISLEDLLYVDPTLHLIVSDLQTKILAADGAPFDYTQPATQAMLDQAKYNLIHSFDAFGIVEFFDVSYALCAQVLGFVPQVAPVRHNVRPGTKKIADIEGELLERLEVHNLFDLDLYSFACALLMKKFDGNVGLT